MDQNIQHVNDVQCQALEICISSNVVQDNERLLKLYESGLPVWAIFLPTYGLYYRPWMRRMTWIIFIAVSIFSMACGFYDLYKNVPHLDQVDHSTHLYVRLLCDHGLQVA